MDVNRIPGMKKGASGRNLLIGIIYFILAIIAIPATPILLLLSPLILGLSAWRNWFGIANRLQRLPGISDTGGLKSGILVYFYCFAIAGVTLIGLTAAMGISEKPSADSNLEASGEAPSDSASDTVGASTTEIATVEATTEVTISEPTTEIAVSMPAYVPVEAKPLTHPRKERVRVSVKLTESRPDITEEEALLIGKDVVESRKGADEIYVHIYQPEGAVGAGACATVKWTKRSGYETDISWVSCHDPEW